VPHIGNRSHQASFLVCRFQERRYLFPWSDSKRGNPDRHAAALGTRLSSWSVFLINSMAQSAPQRSRDAAAGSKQAQLSSTVAA